MSSAWCQNYTEKRESPWGWSLVWDTYRRFWMPWAFSCYTSDEAMCRSSRVPQSLQLWWADRRTVETLPQCICGKPFFHHRKDSSIPSDRWHGNYSDRSDADTTDPVRDRFPGEFPGRSYNRLHRRYGLCTGEFFCLSLCMALSRFAGDEGQLLCWCVLSDKTDPSRLSRGTLCG